MKFGRKDIIEFGIFIALITIATVVRNTVERNRNNSHNNIPSIYKKVNNTYFEKYVYVDNMGTLHTKASCKGIKPFMNVDSVLIDNLRKDHLKKLCTRCISNEQIEQLDNIK